MPQGQTPRAVQYRRYVKYRKKHLLAEAKALENESSDGNIMNEALCGESVPMAILEVPPSLNFTIPRQSLRYEISFKAERSAISSSSSFDGIDIKYLMKFFDE